MDEKPKPSAVLADYRAWTNSRGKPRRLVIDSNEIVRDWFLHGLAFRVLRHLVENHVLHISVPAVVVAEVQAAHAREVDKLMSSIARATRERARLGLKEPETKSEEPTESYLDRLEQVLEALGAEVLPWPETDHQVVVARAVARRPPFDSSGGGYRDTLVWISALNDSASGDLLFLASRDGAFAKPSGVLAPELVEEAAELGVEAVLVTDIGRWVLDQLPWTKELSLPEAAAEVRDDRFRTYLAYSDFPSDLEFEPEEVGLPHSAVILDVSLESSFDLRRVGTKALEPKETLVEYDMDVGLRLRVELDESDAEARDLSHSGTNRTGRVDATVDLPVTIRVAYFVDEYDEGQGWYFTSIRPRFGEGDAPDPPPNPGNLRLWDDP